MLKNRIKIFIIIALTICIFSVQNSYGHKRALYNVIIDTDGGVDDFRSLIFFLASMEFNINAITTVDGILYPEESADLVHQLTDKLNHQGIRIGVGKNLSADKKYRNHALPQWQNTFEIRQQNNIESAISVMHKALDNSKRSNIIVALGPLSNIAELLQSHPEILSKIEYVLWYSNSLEKPSGYNYTQDTDAYEYLVENKVPLKIINGGGLNYNDDFLDICKEIQNSLYADIFVEVMAGFNNKSFWDDIIPLYLLYPTLFVEEQINNYKIKITPKKESHFEVLATTILNHDKPDEGVIFNEIPTSGYMLRSDVNDYVEKIIKAHGYQEFKIAAITSEIHSHLGLYSIIGAKLGLRIMEYLHVGLDEVMITSYAGSNPPISCFNDGVQVGTGATIGYGTIMIAKVDKPYPKVLVEYNNRKIEFSLKQEVIDNIRKEIKELISTHGLESELYWTELRKISLDYWLNTNRHDAFEIKELNF